MSESFLTQTEKYRLKECVWKLFRLLAETTLKR